MDRKREIEEDRHREIERERERKAATNTANKIEKEIVCNCETSLLFWHPFDPSQKRDRRRGEQAGREGAAERTMVSARKESAKFYIWLEVLNAVRKPFLIKMLTGASRNANTLVRLVFE